MIVLKKKKKVDHNKRNFLDDGVIFVKDLC